jgi:hypothetical protein
VALPFGILETDRQAGPTSEFDLQNSPSLGSSHSLGGINHQTGRKTTATPILPSYFYPIPKHLDSDDLDHLQKKGAFNIPSDRFRDAVLSSYAEFVHPYMPLLDIDDFLSDIKDLKGRGRKVSLLVFQAVMFAGTSHVDIKPLRHMGFLTRKAARRALFLRTKVCWQHSSTNFH